MYRQAIEHCVPPLRRHYASPENLEMLIWQQLVDLRLAPQGFYRQFAAQVQRVRESWTNTYGFTFGSIEPPPSAPAAPPSPETRERDRVAMLDQELPACLANCRTLDDVPTDELRSKVELVQSLMDRESVARCVQALLRSNGDPRGAIDWLGRTSQ